MPRPLAIAMLAVLPMSALASVAEGDLPMSLTLTSLAFAEGGEIPARHTCEGEDLSPPLAWSASPAGTKSLALVVDDTNAPDPRALRTTWVHWVLYNLPPGAGSLPEGVGREAALPAGAREGLNDWQRPGYATHVRPNSPTGSVALSGGP